MSDDDDEIAAGEIDDAAPPACPLKFIARNKVTRNDGIELEGQSPPRLEFRFPPASRRELVFRHSSWAVKREKMWRCLQRISASDNRKDAFANCGSQLWLRVDMKNKAIGIACNCCRDRLCEACGRTRAARMVDAIVAAKPEAKLRFMTLTLRCSHSTLKSQIDRLYDSFNKLRRRTFWKWHVKGGAAFLEGKIGQNSGMWHVHLHIVVEGDFIPQRELSREWLEVTGDSSVVDIRRVADFGKTVGYVVKYASKFCDSSVYNSPDKLDEYVIASKGRRFAFTFDSWRGIKLSGESDPGVTWKAIGTIERLGRLAREGDPDAAVYVRMALAKWPGLEVVFGSLDDGG